MFSVPREKMSTTFLSLLRSTVVCHHCYFQSENEAQKGNGRMSLSISFWKEMFEHFFVFSLSSEELDLSKSKWLLYLLWVNCYIFFFFFWSLAVTGWHLHIVTSSLQNHQSLVSPCPCKYSLRINFIWHYTNVKDISLWGRKRGEWKMTVNLLFQHTKNSY